MSYKVKDNKEKQIAIMLVMGFMGQLKGWWDNYLLVNDRAMVLNVVKEEFRDGYIVAKEDVVSTLLCNQNVL